MKTRLILALAVLAATGTALAQFTAGAAAGEPVAAKHGAGPAHG